MNRRTTELLQRLAEADPDEAAATGRFADEPTRQATLELVLAVDPDTRLTRRAGQDRQVRSVRAPRRLWPVAVAAIVAMALVVGVSLLPAPSGHKGVGRLGPVAPAPADAFEAAARVAAQPVLEPGKGQAWLLRQRSTRWVGEGELRAVEDLWFAADGRAWHRVVEAVLPDGPEPVDHGIGTTSFKELSGVALSFAQLRHLPTDQAALRSVLTAAFQRSGDRFTPTKDPAAEMALVLLFFPTLEPAQRAALYKLLSDSPSARVLGKVTDPAGRPAVAVRVDNAAPLPGTNTLVDTFMFDPDSSQMLAWEVKVAKADPRDIVKVRTGQVLHRAVNESWRIVEAPH